MADPAAVKQPEDIVDDIAAIDTSDTNLERAMEELDEIAPVGETPTAPKREATKPNSNGGDSSGTIWNIPVDMHVVIGCVELSVAKLMSLEDGEIIPLDRRIGEPVDIIVNGRNIGKGEITIMEDDETRFGIKITNLASR